MYDIVIAGGGVAGLSLAVALRRTLGDALKLAVLDPAFGRRDGNVRASALTAGSCNLLDAIGVWPDVEGKAQPISAMKISDSRRNDALRPLFLAFDEPLEKGAPFAWMVENRDVLDALETRLSSPGVDVLSRTARRIDVRSQSVEITVQDGSRLAARLIVGADGAGSRIRRISGIETIGREYDRIAIVATVGHEEDHEGVAVQHFLPPGPFAMLPLKGRRSSIVWTEYVEEARRALSLPDDEFQTEVERRFGPGLGRLSLLSKPTGFPLRVQMARRFTSRRVALVGDAAHLVHPLAGQGLNLGLRDVAALTGLIAERVRLGLDPGGDDVLGAYDRARYFDTVAMIAGTDGLHRLFSNDASALRLIRDIGLGMVDRMPRLKRALVREAAGLAGDTPVLLQGRLP